MAGALATADLPDALVHPADATVGTQLSEDYRGHNIVFIVGCPRSGTTWLQRLLASHPQLRTGQESHVFEYIHPSLRRWHRQMATNVEGGRGGVGLPCYFSEAEFMPILRRYMFALLEPMVGDLAPGELFIEKTPAHALYVREIMEMLPEARIIHLLRDPRDVTASLLAASKSWGTRWAPRNAAKAARKWTDHVEQVRQIEAEIPAGQYLEVRYEQLHQSTRGTLRQIAGFLAVEWDEVALQHAIDTNSADQVRAGGGTAIPVGGAFRTASGVATDPPGFTRKARPNAWREDLSHIERVQIWLVARKLMAQVGYRWVAPW